MRAATLLLAAAALALSGCTPEFDPEFDPEIKVEESTAPTWCPTSEDLQEIIGDDFGTWAYDDIGPYDCRLSAATDTDELSAQFYVFQKDDGWWEEVSTPPYGEFEFDRRQPIGDNLALVWSGPNKDAQGMCDLVMPGQYWALDFSGSGNPGGACDIVLDIYQTLEDA